MDSNELFKSQVMFPTGVKVELVRNYWGIDVTILTTRAQTPFQESGICLYDRHKDGNNITAFGENHRYEFYQASILWKT